MDIKELYNKKHKDLDAEEKIVSRAFKATGELPLVHKIPLYGVQWRVWWKNAVPFDKLFKAFKPLPLSKFDSASIALTSFTEAKEKKKQEAAPFWITYCYLTNEYVLHWIAKCFSDTVRVSVRIKGWQHEHGIVKRWQGGNRTIWFNRHRVNHPREVVCDRHD